MPGTPSLAVLSKVTVCSKERLGYGKNRHGIQSPEPSSWSLTPGQAANGHVSLSPARHSAVLQETAPASEPADLGSSSSPVITQPSPMKLGDLCLTEVMKMTVIYTRPIRHLVTAVTLHAKAATERLSPRSLHRQGPERQKDVPQARQSPTVCVASWLSTSGHGRSYFSEATGPHSKARQLERGCVETRHVMAATLEGAGSRSRCSRLRASRDQPGPAVTWGLSPIT